MIDNCKLSKNNYPIGFKSIHWDLFPSNYLETIADASQWSDFRCNGFSTGFDFPAREDNSKGPYVATDPSVVRDVTQRYNSLSAVVGTEFISSYRASDLGNPYRSLVDGMELNSHDLRSIHDAWRIFNLYKDRRDEALLIVDIGAGLGALLEKLKKLFPRARFVSLDLPEVNAVQTYFLGKSFPKARFLTYSDFMADPSSLNGSDFDFAILPGWCIDQLAEKSVDLFINTRSMMEMNLEIISFYFEHIHRAVQTNGGFYCVNRYEKSTVGVPIRIKDYPFDNQWMFQISQPAWNQTWIHELAAFRTEQPLAHSSQTLLAVLPPVSWGDAGNAIVKCLRIMKALIWGVHTMVNPGIKGRTQLKFRKIIRWLHDTPAVYAVNNRLLYKTLRPVYRALTSIFR
jgi:putative sugar O-methyltransferase